MSLNDSNYLKVALLGHVDHGKSTLLGRLLADTSSVPKDRIEKVKRICEENNKNFEYSFLLDAFQEEHKQGITIDYCQISFSSQMRSYSFIDNPGHKEFLKNAFSGASCADCAVLLIDILEGVREQTAQHLDLLELLSINDLIVIISKMDLVAYEEEKYKGCLEAVSQLTERRNINIHDVIPISAKHGDNILKESPKTSWYRGKSFLSALDSFPVKEKKHFDKFRMYVQDVYKFSEVRYVVGRVEAGELNLGDKIQTFPRLEVLTVKDIYRWEDHDKGGKPARVGDSVALEFYEAPYLERGDLLFTPETPPAIARKVKAKIFWMGKEPLKKGSALSIRLGSSCHHLKVNQIYSQNMSGSLPMSLPRHEIGVVEFESNTPIAYDCFNLSPSTSRFIAFKDLMPLAGGYIIHEESNNLWAKFSGQIKSQNISWVNSKISLTDREKVNGHKGCILWFTGLSGAGKSSIAIELEKQLMAMKVQSFVLDGDNIRHALNFDLGFSVDDRMENLRRVGEVSKLFLSAGFITISAFISPFELLRSQLKEKIGERFFEVFVDCPMEECEKRDPKGLYAKARKGEIKDFTGISATFEAPKDPDIILKTKDYNLGECVGQLIEFLRKKKILGDLE